MNDLLNKPCPICGETKPEMFKIWFDGYLKLYKCLSCSFVAQYPGPGNFTIVTNYENEYSLDFLENGGEFMYPQRRRVLQNILDHIVAQKVSGKILDVGCGDGHLLYLCANTYSCYGVEDSKSLSSYASQKTGADITQGLYQKNMFQENSFDIITFIQVLEHIPNPVDALETAMYHLRPGGILVIEVPSIQSPHFLLYRWTKIKKFVKPPTGVIWNHCNYFTPKTLGTLVSNIGFKDLSFTIGRWQYKYSGFFGKLGKIIDPILNSLKVGGILLIAQKEKDNSTLP